MFGVMKDTFAVVADKASTCGVLTMIPGSVAAAVVFHPEVLLSPLVPSELYVVIATRYDVFSNKFNS